MHYLLKLKKCTVLIFWLVYCAEISKLNWVHDLKNWHYCTVFLVLKLERQRPRVELLWDVAVRDLGEGCRLYRGMVASSARRLKTSLSWCIAAPMEGLLSCMAALHPNRFWFLGFWFQIKTEWNRESCLVARWFKTPRQFLCDDSSKGCKIQHPTTSQWCKKNWKGFYVLSYLGRSWRRANARIIFWLLLARIDCRRARSRGEKHLTLC